MTITAVPRGGGDQWEMAAQINLADNAGKQEIRTLALKIKDVELALEILAYGGMSSAQKDTLISKISKRLNPELHKRIGKKSNP